MAVPSPSRSGIATAVKRPDHLPMRDWMPRSHIIHRLGTRFVQRETPVQRPAGPQDRNPPFNGIWDHAHSSGGRCRSWVRFMGPKRFTRSWDLGWGGHRPTYLYLTGVGSACKLPGSARAIARQDW